MDALPCSVSSRQAGEPAAGTAVARTWRWLGIEYRPTWAPKGVERAELPHAVRAWLDRFLAEPGARAQLLRRPGRTSEPLVVQYADTAAGSVRQVEIDRYEDLLDLDLDALPLREGPVVWVCTHGQRDVCCARYGGRVFAAATEALGDAAWQTSHLGGHRFAATLLTLPDGVCYGRLREVDVPGLLAAHRRGELYRIDTVRGRVAWSRAAQAAEVALRRATGERRIGAVELVNEGDDHVVLRLAGEEHRVGVARSRLPDPVVPSCGKAAEPTTTITATLPASPTTR